MTKRRLAPTNHTNLTPKQLLLVEKAELSHLHAVAKNPNNAIHKAYRDYATNRINTIDKQLLGDIKF